MLARDLESEVLTADSRQVYRGMDIGTAKPRAEGVPRHLIDLVDPDEPFSAGAYTRAAEPLIERLHARGKVPIIEGGTGLYLRALLQGLWQGPPADPELRSRLWKEERQAPGWLYRMLIGVDPAGARRIHPNDKVKLLRAVEVYRLTGRAMSWHHARQGFAEGRYQTLRIGILRDREALRRRIQERIDRQMKEGLLEEIRTLLATGYSPELPSMQGLGYRQMILHLQGKATFREALDRFTLETRRYAKRQLTWFRADPRVIWIPLPDQEGPREAFERIAGLKEYRNLKSDRNML